MMQKFLFRFGQNMASRRNQTLGVLAGLFGAIVMAWILINAIFAINIFALIIAAPLVIWSAAKVPQLAWFWGASASSALPSMYVVPPPSWPPAPTPPESRPTAVRSRPP